ncbi:MAG: PQQ-binding-like beta-propeller repeat protein [Acidobacteriota bacterium]
MRRIGVCGLGLLLAAVAVAESSWPQFRGHGARGHADGPPPPLTWDVESGENIRWSVPIPGLGHASPIVAGSKIFIATAIGKGAAELKTGLYGSPKPVDDEGEQQWVLLALDRATGQIAWGKTAVTASPASKRHPKSSHANSTPVTDGERVCVFYGTPGLFCYRVADGVQLWSKEFGLLSAGSYNLRAAEWGFGNSLSLHDGVLLVQADTQELGFIAAFDVTDGRQLWRRERDDVSTWSTPTVHVGAERSQVIVNGFRHIGGYDLRTGDPLWKLRGGGDVPVPTPFVADDLIFITNSHGLVSPTYAIELDAEGEIVPDYNALGRGEAPPKGIRWAKTKGGGYMVTPIVVDGRLYVLRNNGIFTVYDTRSGTELHQGRLSGSHAFTASPVAVGKRVYFTAESGEVFVVEAGETLEILARNPLGIQTLSTPAIADGTIYFRTRDSLIAVGETASETAASEMVTTEAVATSID